MGRLKQIVSGDAVDLKYKLTTGIPDHIRGIIYIYGNPYTDGSVRLIVDKETGTVCLEKKTDGAWQASELCLGASTLYLGESLGIAAAGGHIMGTHTGGTRLYPYTDISGVSGGTGPVKVLNLGNRIERIVVASDDSGEFIGTEWKAVAGDFPPPFDVMSARAYWRIGSVAATAPVRVKVYKGTDETGELIFDYNFSASTFGPANTEISFELLGLVLSNAGQKTYGVYTSDEPFSLRTNAAVTTEWLAFDVYPVTYSSLLKTGEFVSGNTYIDGDWFIDTDTEKIYICNTTGVQTGTFADNAALWDLVSERYIGDYLTTSGIAYGDTDGRIIDDPSYFSYNDTDKTATIDGQIVSRKGGSIYEIFTMGDFPTPAAGVITLASGKYIIKNNLSTSDRFFVGSGSYVTIEVDDRRENAFTYTGTSTFFTGTDATRITFDSAHIICSGNGAKFVDISGGTFNFVNTRLTMTGSGCVIGDVSDANNVILRNLNISGYTDGITITDIDGVLINQVAAQGTLTGTGAVFNLINSISYFGLLTALSIVVGPSESIFYIDPTIIAPINIVNIVRLGVGYFFKPYSSSGSITSISDQSIVAASVTAVSDNGSGKARFTSTSHGLSVGEIVDHSTFTESTYNGTSLVVTAVPTASTYDIDSITYISTDTGQLDADTVQITSNLHGLSNGDKIRIDGTVDYDCGCKVFNVATNTFEVNAVYVSSQTGTWDDGSQDQKSKYVFAERNGDQKDSTNIGSVIAGGNTQQTSIPSPNTYVDLNLNGTIVEASDIELWTLTNTTTGELRYDGCCPVSLQYKGLIAASTAVTNQVYSIRLLKNGSPLSAPDNVNIPIGIFVTLSSSSLLWSIMVEPGDKFRMQIANTSSAANAVIDTLKISID